MSFSSADIRNYCNIFQLINDLFLNTNNIKYIIQNVFTRTSVCQSSVEINKKIRETLDSLAFNGSTVFHDESCSAALSHFSLTMIILPHLLISRLLLFDSLSSCQMGLSIPLLLGASAVSGKS